MKISIFAPNGVITYESCPVCELPSMEVRHGRRFIMDTDSGKEQDSGLLQHFETCSECGESMPIVCYDCEDCLVERVE